MRQRLNNRDSVPPGGFRYLQEDTNVWIRAASFTELARAVRAHRTANNIPSGIALEDEIEAQLCTFMPPGVCSCGDKLETRRAALIAQPTWKKFKEATKAVLEVTKSGLTSAEEAASQAATCAKCPFNQSPEEGCTSCAASEIVNMIAGYSIKPTPSDAKLKACLLCGCGLKAKVHLPQATALKLAEKSGYHDLLPEWCWIKGQ